MNRKAKSKFDDFLRRWIACFSANVFASPGGPHQLVNTLSCEKLPDWDYESLPADDRKTVTAFRHLTQEARLSVCSRVLNEVRDERASAKASENDAANKWKTYELGWRHGATGRAFQFDREDPNPLASIYHHGYRHGMEAHGDAGEYATKTYGYKPSILRGSR